MDSSPRGNLSSSILYLMCARRTRHDDAAILDFLRLFVYYAEEDEFV